MSWSLLKNILNIYCINIYCGIVGQPSNSPFPQCHAVWELHWAYVVLWFEYYFRWKAAGGNTFISAAWWPGFSFWLSISLLMNSAAGNPLTLQYFRSLQKQREMGQEEEECREMRREGNIYVCQIRIVHVSEGISECYTSRSQKIPICHLHTIFLK